MSERPLVPLAAPLMDWRMLPSVPKCITITVIRDTCRLTWSPGDKHGIRTKDGMEIELGHLQESVSVYMESMFEGNNITVECRLW